MIPLTTPDLLISMELRQADSKTRTFLGVTDSQAHAIRDSLNASIDEPDERMQHERLLKAPFFDRFHNLGAIYHGVLKDTLTADQLTKYECMIIQLEGLTALYRESIGRRLELTEEQRRKIHSLAADAGESARLVQGLAGFDNDEDGREKARKELVKRQIELDRKILAVLNEKQLEALKALPFPEKGAAKLIFRD